MLIGSISLYVGGPFSRIRFESFVTRPDRCGLVVKFVLRPTSGYMQSSFEAKICLKETATRQVPDDDTVMTTSPTPLDLDSLLRSHGGDLFSSSSDDDDDEGGGDAELPPAVRRRTVEEILNDSDSDSDSDSSSFHLAKTPVLVSKALTLTPEQKPTEGAGVAEEVARRVQESVSEIAEEPSTSFDWRRRSRELSASVALSSLGLWNATSSSSSSSSSSRPLPSLFGGVRPNPKPGAALAAAAAASRAVPTPHAVAIKNRRASIGSVWKDLEESGGDAVGSAGSEGLDGSERSEVTVVSENLEPGGVEGEVLRSSGEASEDVHGDDEVSEAGHGSVSANEIVTPGKLEEDAMDLETGQELSVHVIPDENAPKVDDDLLFTDDVVVHENTVDTNKEAEPEMPEMEREDIGEENSPDEVRSTREETQVVSDIDRLIEERLVQLENSKKAEKKAEKKLRASMKPLEWAEELEKRHASSGLHWEEGVAAQPMRLEGIRRGPPAVGYLQIDLDNAITRAISSQSFKRDHGSPQVVAVHMNYIAVGMSKGTVIVLTSKYSTHLVDNMDSKVGLGLLACLF